MSTAERAHGVDGEIDEAFAECEGIDHSASGTGREDRGVSGIGIDLYTYFVTALKAGNMERLKECTTGLRPLYSEGLAT